MAKHLLLAFLILQILAPKVAGANPLVCANLFKAEPQLLHGILFSRARDDERLGVRRFDAAARISHRVTVHDGLLYYKGQILDTAAGTADGIHRRGIQILALDRDMNLITTEHAPAGVLHHSTLTGGEPGYFFGEWRVRAGKVTMVSNMSGHTLPPVQQLYVFVGFLRDLGVLHPDVDVVEIHPDFSID